MAQECTGAAIWITLDKNAKAKGHHTLSKVPRRKRTRTSYFCKKGERHLHDKNIRESDCLLEKADQCVKARGTTISSLASEERERVAGAQTRETEVLARSRPASQSAACKGFQHVGCHL